MEMCYDGTLVMPSSYAVMSEDEMTYVEGGGFFSWDRTVKIATGIIAIVGAVGTIFSALNGAIKFGATIKGVSEAAFVSGVASKVAAIVGKLTAWIGAHFNVIAGILAGAIAAVGGYCVGKEIAKNVGKRVGYK